MPSILSLASALSAALLLFPTTLFAREVNQDDLWGDCVYWESCIDVVTIAEECGTAKDVDGGKLFTHNPSQPKPRMNL
jgi:hypothetical protein